MIQLVMNKDNVVDTMCNTCVTYIEIPDWKLCLVLYNQFKRCVYLWNRDVLLSVYEIIHVSSPHWHFQLKAMFRKLEIATFPLLKFTGLCGLINRRDPIVILWSSFVALHFPDWYTRILIEKLIGTCMYRKLYTLRFPTSCWNWTSCNIHILACTLWLIKRLMVGYRCCF